FHRDIREHAKLLDVRTAHQVLRSVIESVYDRGAAREFLNSLLRLSLLPLGIKTQFERKLLRTWCTMLTQSIGVIF
ncbi:MAG: hypothetical protein ABI227_00545, partial [Rhodanobacter sp.]